MLEFASMHLEVKHLKLVQAIQQERSITNAGTKLHLTQSAVSHQLKEIEERLGTALFVRTRRDVQLTRAGERLLNSAAVVLNELQRAEEDIAEIAGAPRGSVRISTQCYTAYHWLPSLVKRFNAKYPHIAVEINVDATYRAVDAVLEGALDLALTNERSDHDRLRYRAVFDDELVAVVPESHSLAERKFLRPKDFAEETLLIPSALTSSYFYCHFLEPASVMPKKWCSVPLTEAIIAMVKEEMGISVVARWIVQPYLRSHVLRAVRISKKGLYREWWSVVLNRGMTPKYLDDFVSLMSAQVPASLG
jgi:LysR family transcriptional regulator for metE and metH